MCIRDRSSVGCDRTCFTGKRVKTTHFWASGCGLSAVSTSSAVVPTGFPHTGMGGAARGPSADLIGLGILSLAGAAGVTMLVARRRSDPSEY